MLLQDECGHLLLDGDHLLIELPQPPHKMAVAMDLCCEGTVLNAGQCRVHFRKLVPCWKELLQILKNLVRSNQNGALGGFLPYALGRQT